MQAVSPNFVKLYLCQLVLDLLDLFLELLVFLLGSFQLLQGLLGLVKN